MGIGGRPQIPPEVDLSIAAIISFINREEHVCDQAVAASRVGNDLVNLGEEGGRSLVEAVDGHSSRQLCSSSTGENQSQSRLLITG